MATEHKPPLTSSEIGVLWFQFMGDTMARSVEKFSAAKEKDDQSLQLYNDAILIIESTIAQIRLIFQNEGIPLPQGFTDEDVHIDAPPLYSDIYRLQYLKFKTNLRMAMNGLFKAESTRADVRKLFRDISIAYLDLDDRTTDLLLEKGLYIRSPYITVGEKADLVHNQSFLGNFFGGVTRNLLAPEIGTLFSNIRNNIIGKTLLTGFSQVTEFPDVRRYYNRGIEIADKHIQIFSDLLRKENVPIPMSSDSGVTNSTIAPFSEKLMLFHADVLNQVGVAAYGTAISASMRKDLQVCYTRLVAEIAEYALDGANLLIDNKWMDEPPEVVDHRELGFQQEHLQ